MDRPGIRLSPHFYNTHADIDRTVTGAIKTLHMATGASNEGETVRGDREPLVCAQKVKASAALFDVAFPGPFGGLFPIQRNPIATRIVRPPA